MIYYWKYSCVMVNYKAIILLLVIYFILSNPFVNMSILQTFILKGVDVIIAFYAKIGRFFDKNLKCKTIHHVVIFVMYNLSVFGIYFIETKNLTNGDFKTQVKRGFALKKAKFIAYVWCALLAILIAIYVYLSFSDESIDYKIMWRACTTLALVLSILLFCSIVRNVETFNIILDIIDEIDAELKKIRITLDYKIAIVLFTSTYIEAILNFTRFFIFEIPPFNLFDYIEYIFLVVGTTFLLFFVTIHAGILFVCAQESYLINNYIRRIIKPKSKKNEFYLYTKRSLATILKVASNIHFKQFHMMEYLMQLTSFPYFLFLYINIIANAFLLYYLLYLNTLVSRINFLCFQTFAASLFSLTCGHFAKEMSQETTNILAGLKICNFDEELRSLRNSFVLQGLRCKINLTYKGVVYLDHSAWILVISTTISGMVFMLQSRTSTS